MADYIKKNPGLTRYKFLLEKKYLKGEDFVKEDLDAICPDAELQIQEGEGHSIWINSKLLERHGITDDTPDPVPGLSYYVRKDGHVTGNIFEGTAEMPIILDGSMELTDAQTLFPRATGEKSRSLYGRKGKTQCVTTRHWKRQRRSSAATAPSSARRKTN